VREHLPSHGTDSNPLKGKQPMHRKNSTTPKLKTSSQPGSKGSQIASEEEARRQRSQARWNTTQAQITKLIEQLVANHEAVTETAVDPVDQLRWDTTKNRVRGLVERILIHEDNDQGLALVALLNVVNYGREGMLDREAIGDMAMDLAFIQTLAFANFAAAFRERALTVAELD
jgi:hypothetical protein